MFSACIAVAATFGFGLLGGFEALFPPLEPSSDAWMRPLYNIIYFLPLLIPLTTYLVIARWTGANYFVHS